MPPLDDQNRFQRVLEMLPENFMQDFLGAYLYNGYYPWEYVQILDTFDNTKDQIMFEFDDRVTQAAFVSLKETFDDLDAFLVQHFSIPRIHYRMYENPPFLYLEPRIHHNFYHSEGEAEIYTPEMRAEFEGLRNELERLRDRFSGAYISFLRAARRIGKGSVAVKQKVSEWWNTSWFQALMAIIAVIGLVGGGSFVINISRDQTTISGDYVKGNKSLQNNFVSLNSFYMASSSTNNATSFNDCAKISYVFIGGQPAGVPDYSDCP